VPGALAIEEIGAVGGTASVPNGETPTMPRTLAGSA
jgi:hypothetical protein